jgi:hypothetical protein
LLYTFCKAFDLLDGNKADVNSAKFQAFANAWDTFISQEPIELDKVVKGVYGVTTKITYVTADSGTSDDGPSTGTVTGGPFHPAMGQTGNPGSNYPSQGPGTRPQPGYNPYPGGGPTSQPGSGSPTQPYNPYPNGGPKSSQPGSGSPTQPYNPYPNGGPKP